MEHFGICHLAFYPLRKEPNHRSEMISQVLFGELFSIIDTWNDEWYFIELEFDKYKGWISSNDIRFLDSQKYIEANKNKKYFSSEYCQMVFSEKRQFTIGFGSRLPFFNDNSFEIGDEKFMIKGEVSESLLTKNIDWLMDKAKSFLGIPYLWGGKSIYGIDCSGFVQNIYKFIDIRLPRDSNEQAEIGISQIFSEALPGDLAFFKNENEKIIHVGIVCRDNKIIHASGQVRIDILDEKGIFNEEIEKYTHTLAKINRVIKN